MEQELIKCPFCQSNKIRRFVYGLLSFKDAEDEKQFLEKYVKGGCRLSGENPVFHCDKCGKNFGKIKDLLKEK